MKRQFSIRQSLLLGLTLLILFTSGAILVSTIISAFRASEELTREVIDEAGLLVTQETDLYFKEVERSLRMVSSWARANELGPDDEDRLTPLLQPLIKESPWVSSILLANASGAEFMFLQNPTDRYSWSTRLVDPSHWEDQAYIRKWNTHKGLLSEGLEPFEYDTKNRLYYRIAMEADSDTVVDWTPPAIFFTTRDPGMTAVTRWTDANGETTVLAFDVLLLDISRMTATRKISERGSAFVLSESKPHRIIGLPRFGNDLDDAAIRARLLPETGAVADADTRPELPVAGRSGIATLDAATLQWDTLGRPDGSLPFELANKTWWAHFSRTQVGQNSFVVGAIAPQADFLTGLGDSARTIALVTLLALILSSLLAIRLASYYARPLEALAEASRRIRELDLSPPEDFETRLHELRDLQNEQEHTRVALASFARYIPVEIVRGLVARGVAAKIGGERRIITILFTDIEGFTTIAENRSAEAVTTLLSEYFETLLETIRANGGEVNQLLGDGVVAYWGAPIPDEDHASRSVKAILECHERVLALSARFVREGKPPLPTRFGVASGEVMIGNMGSKSRLAYTAIGDTANLASRIENLNRFYGTRLMVAEETRNLTGNEFEWRHVDGVRVKGKAVAVELFEPLGPKGSVHPDKLAFRDQYEAALNAYRGGNFQDALRIFSEMKSTEREELSVVRLQHLSTEFLRTPPPAGWDGITDYHVK